MMIQKSIAYILARGIPGVISLISIMVYTRLLSPEVYGQFAIAFSLAGLVATVCFQWLQFSLLRYYPKTGIDIERINSNLFFPFIALSIVVVPIFILLLSYSFAYLTISISCLIVLLTLSHGFFDLSIQIPVSKGEAGFYGLLLIAKSSLALLLAVIFIYLGYQLQAPLMGLVFSYGLLSLLLIKKYWCNISWQLIDKKLLNSMLLYGLPLSGTFVMNYIMANSDRLMLAWLLDEKSSGLYSAAYDLSNFSFIVIILSIHLAFYPMILKAFEAKENGETQSLLQQNIVVIALISIVPGILFTVLVADFAHFTLGENFWQVAIQTIPVITLATFFLGLKAYYFDLSFLLSHKTSYLLLIGLIGSLFNILFNYFFIQYWGIIGAAYATCLSYFCILCLSVFWGRKFYPLPLPYKQLLQVLCLFLFCIVSLWLLQQVLGAGFFLQLLVFILIYLLGIYAFNFLEVRQVSKAFCAQRIKNLKS